MKKILVILVVILAILIGVSIARAEDSKEILLLKKDNLTLRIQNLQLQLQMAPEYQALVKELREVNDKLTAMEPKKEEPVKKEKEKK